MIINNLPPPPPQKKIILETNILECHVMSIFLKNINKKNPKQRQLQNKGFQLEQPNKSVAMSDDQRNIVW